MSTAPSLVHRRGASRDDKCPASTDSSRHITSVFTLTGTCSSGVPSHASSRTGIAQAKAAAESFRVAGRRQGWIVNGSVWNGIPPFIPRRNLGSVCRSFSRSDLLVKDHEMTCLLQRQAPTSSYPWDCVSIPIESTAVRVQLRKAGFSPKLTRPLSEKYVLVG